MNVGFTGTRTGMTNAQLFELNKILWVEAIVMTDASTSHEFHHGNCIGADEQAARIAKKLGYKVIAHPSTIVSTTSVNHINDVELSAKPPLDRNHDIVDVCDILVAAPKGPEELRSGTWATIRYADSIHKPIVIITPAGDVT